MNPISQKVLMKSKKMQCNKTKISKFKQDLNNSNKKETNFLYLFLPQNLSKKFKVKN